MAKPRIFVSSTYYDLKYIRSSLENFINSFGYEPILSEKGDIAYMPDAPLDESCYREVRNADVFIIIIGGRYGSEKSDGKTKLPKAFFDKYDSITKQEFRSAASQDIPIYILIEKSVYSDYETYLRNKENETINYAHVDSINIFLLIEEILALPRNNPVLHFDRYEEIEEWLRDQWAGLFRELINHKSSGQQLASLSAQVLELSEVNKTLKTYLEQVVSKIAPDQSAELIKTESKRLELAKQFAIAKDNSLAIYFSDVCNIPMERILSDVQKAETLDEYIKLLKKDFHDTDTIRIFDSLLNTSREPATRDFKRLRSELSFIDDKFEEKKGPTPRIRKLSKNDK